MDRDIVDESLSLLGELLDEWKQRPVHLVVSGGSALLAAGIISRTTHDVDVLAMRGEVDGEIIGAYPLPEFLKEAARQVAAEKGLEEGWLNATTALLMIDLRRFPGDFLSDLRSRTYGEYLSVSFIGRAGQIYLKFFAAVGRNEARDLDDLRAIGPTPSEAERAAKWLIDEQVISRLQVPKLLSTLEALGHHALLSQIKSEAP